MRFPVPATDYHAYHNRAVIDASEARGTRAIPGLLADAEVVEDSVDHVGCDRLSADLA